MTRVSVISEYVMMDLGRLDVETVDNILLEFVDKRQRDIIPDSLLFLSYPSCLTIGARQPNEQDFLKPMDYFKALDIPLYKTNRGGGLTYHWPEQLLCYPVLKLQPHEQNIPQYMSKLEEIGLKTLAEIGIAAHQKREVTAQIGLWVGDNKIASMGIRISRWVTSYGFALNLSGDASPSQSIRPCGLDVDLITVESQIGKAPDREKTKRLIHFYFEKIYRRRPMTNVNDHQQMQEIVNAYRNRIVPR